MPIYEYECITCGTTFEKRQSFSDAPVADCPNGHSDTRRLLSAPAIVFKGSGFYINDSKSASKQSANGTSKSDKSDSSTSAGSSSDTTAKTESKAETKTEAKAKTEA
ncbi:MAG: zinc ribbon domain-containing protein [Anaerolineae bacterium]